MEFLDSENNAAISGKLLFPTTKFWKLHILVMSNSNPSILSLGPCIAFASLKMYWYGQILFIISTKLLPM